MINPVPVRPTHALLGEGQSFEIPIQYVPIQKKALAYQQDNLWLPGRIYWRLFSSGYTYRISCISSDKRYNGVKV